MLESVFDGRLGEAVVVLDFRWPKNLVTSDGCGLAGSKHSVYPCPTRDTPYLDTKSGVVGLPCCSFRTRERVHTRFLRFLFNPKQFDLLETHIHSMYEYMIVYVCQSGLPSKRPFGVDDEFEGRAAVRTGSPMGVWEMGTT